MFSRHPSGSDPPPPTPPGHGQCLPVGKEIQLFDPTSRNLQDIPHEPLHTLLKGEARRRRKSVRRVACSVNTCGVPVYQHTAKKCTTESSRRISVSRLCLVQWVPPNYYDTSLEERARELGCSKEQLCKTMIMENKACAEVRVFNTRHLCRQKNAFAAFSRFVRVHSGRALESGQALRGVVKARGFSRV